MTRVLFIFAMLCCCNFAAAQIDFRDNFNSESLDPSWSVFDSISFATGEPHVELSFSDGTLRLNAPQTPNPEFGPPAGALSLSAHRFTDFEISVDIIENNSSVDGFVGLGSRIPAPFAGYFFSLAAIQEEIAPAARSIAITRSDGPTSPIIELAAEYRDDLPLEEIKLVFRGDGNTLTGELFHLNDLANPILTLTAEDDTYASGYGEIFTFGGTPPPPFPRNLESFGNARLDNFSLTATIPEPSAALLAVIGMLAVGNWRRHRIRVT